MLNITRLLGAEANFGDSIRYGHGIGAESTGDGASGVDTKSGVASYGPVVVLNLTNRCNLLCRHCYAGAGSQDAGAIAEELTLPELEKLFREFNEMNVPAVLLSGGEPLMRTDIFEIAELARAAGLRATLSTNGTLIDSVMAGKIAESGFSYVGTSLDGRPERHDHFRGVGGAFEKSLAGIRLLKEHGVKTGIRFTVTKDNVSDLPFILNTAEEQSVDRICVYHLVYSGRGRELEQKDLSKDENRRLLDLLIETGRRYVAEGRACELLTVDNHADGAYLYLSSRADSAAAAENIWQSLLHNGGNNSGQKIACVDHLGNVHPDQFWTHSSLGNIRDRGFKSIWRDDPPELLLQLRSRKERLKERCHSCRFLDICNGNFRVRAELGTGDLWAEDPACYLTDAEVSGL